MQEVDLEPKVTIVIVTWNKKKDVLNLLDSLRDINYTKYEIIVVDNASEDDSAEAIKAHDVNVHLLKNKVNLGGTGGFNTGIRYAINCLEQDYLWLLDNDAEVTPETLRELVRVAESDGRIGVAGSCILSPENRDLLVEAGAFVDWYAGTWVPNLRYRKWSEVHQSNVVDVDYVAACSALVRASVAMQLNGMDDRYFLHWDDIDFCLTLGSLGYRCVSVLSSKVYHGVEKGFNPQVVYYDFRNGLITISKHLVGIRKLRAYGVICFNAFATLVLEMLMGRKDLSRLMFASITDFISGRYGKAPFSINIRGNKNPMKPVESDVVKKDLGNAIVFSEGAYDEIITLFSCLRELSPSSKLTFLVNSERIGLFHMVTQDDLFLVGNMRDSIVKKMTNAFKILVRRFDCGISSESELINPYVFMVKKHYVYDAQERQFYLSERSLIAIWKVFIAVLAGVIGAVVSLPVVWAVGLKERTVRYVPIAVL